MTEVPYLLLRVSENVTLEKQRVGAVEGYSSLLGSVGVRAVCRREQFVGIDEVKSEALRFRSDVSGPIAVVIEYAASAPRSLLAYLCAQVHEVMLMPEVAQVIVSVESVKELEGTGILDKVYAGEQTPVRVVDDASAFLVSAGGALVAAGQPVARSPRTVQIQQRIEFSELYPRLGHFRCGMVGVDLHCNVVPNLDAIRQGPNTAIWQRLVATVRADIEIRCGGEPYVIYPVEWPGGELERLALEVCHGDVSRLHLDADHFADGVGVCVSLSLTPLSARMHREIAAQSRIPSAARLECVNLIGDGRDVPAVVPIPSVGWGAFAWECIYCEQGVPLDGDSIDQLTNELHSQVFWDLIGWTPDHVFRRHFPSPSTPNHFNLKIEAKPIFRKFGHTLAERMAGVLRSQGILPSWIDGIISTQGDEAETLVPFLGARLGVPEDRHVQIPSHVRSLAERPGVDPGLEAWAAEIGDRLNRLNVVLVDQAAHHLRTLSALRKSAIALGARPLAFSVVVDRTGNAFEHAPALYHGLQVAPLYTWDCPPWRNFECNCRNTVELRL